MKVRLFDGGVTYIHNSDRYTFSINARMVNTIAAACDSCGKANRGALFAWVHVYKDGERYGKMCTDIHCAELLANPIVAAPASVPVAPRRIMNLADLPHFKNGKRNQIDVDQVMEFLTANRQGSLV